MFRLIESSKENNACHTWFQGPDDYKPQLLSTAEITEKIGIERFSEDLFYIGDKPNATKENTRQPTSVEDVIKLLKHPNNNDLEIRFINKDVGYGLFARRDFRQGEPICLYAGVLNKNFRGGKYSVDGIEHLISAEQYGGVGRFIQHMPANNWSKIISTINMIKNKKIPDLSTLKHISFEAGITLILPEDNAGYDEKKRAFNLNIKDLFDSHLISIAQKNQNAHLEWFLDPFLIANSSNIAFSNCIVLHQLYQGAYVPYLQARSFIPKGSQIGFSYGNEHFKSTHTTIKYFNAFNQNEVIQESILTPQLVDSLPKPLDIEGYFKKCQFQAPIAPLKIPSLPRPNAAHPLISSTTSNKACHTWFKGPNQDEAELLSEEEIAKIIGLKKFSEELLYQGSKPTSINSNPSYEANTKDIEKLLTHPNNNDLEIRYMNPVVGYGLFARRDFRQGEPICLYAGIVNTNKENDIYAIEWMNENTISAKEYGGVGRFIQHMPSINWSLFFGTLESILSKKPLDLPALEQLFDRTWVHFRLPNEEESKSKEKIKEYQIAVYEYVYKKIQSSKSNSSINWEWLLDPLLRKNASEIAFANSRLINNRKYNGYPVPYLQAKRFISAGSQIGFSYGYHYFGLSTQPIQYFSAFEQEKIKQESLIGPGKLPRQMIKAAFDTYQALTRKKMASSDILDRVK